MLYKRLLISFASLLIVLLLPTYASAHTGGGPPFLEINGKYAQTNPFFSNDPNINIPQDINPETQPLVVNQPIEFKVDTTQLLVPPEIANSSIFRWTFDENKNYQFGKIINYTYHKPKSYLISLEVKAQTDPDYTLIDTVQVNILPKVDYQVPKLSIALEINKHQSNKPIKFIGNYKLDPSAKAKTTVWSFGDSTTDKNPITTHTYSNITNYTTFPVIFRVIDNNNFITDSGVIIQSVDNKLHFFDANGKENTILVSDEIKVHTNHSTNKGSKNLHVELLIVLGIITMLASLITIGKIVKRKD